VVGFVLNPFILFFEMINLLKMQCYSIEFFLVKLQDSPLYGGIVLSTALSVIMPYFALMKRCIQHELYRHHNCVGLAIMGSVLQIHRGSVE
jgi:hypothetical protein